MSSVLQKLILFEEKHDGDAASGGHLVPVSLRNSDLIERLPERVRGELIRALSPITNKEQKSMTGSEPCAKREELGLSRKQSAERLNIHEFEIAE
jgi:hypothetical protein